jgi:hypothetical protein
MVGGKMCLLTFSETPANYHRALIWTGVMTAVTHLVPAFSAVASIEAMNEPIMDASKTPGMGDCKYFPAYTVIRNLQPYILQSRRTS